MSFDDDIRQTIYRIGREGDNTQHYYYVSKELAAKLSEMLSEAINSAEDYDTITEQNTAKTPWEAFKGLEQSRADQESLPFLHLRLELMHQITNVLVKHQEETT